MKKAALWIVLALVSPALVSGADFSSVVEERQELMKANREAQKALKSAADAGDLATIEVQANRRGPNSSRKSVPRRFSPQAP